jgi:transcriptional regulator with XRE-family HTH domain
MIPDTLGDKIRNLRKSKNMTQETLSAFLIVSRRAVSRYENNEVVPPLETLHAIARVFNIDVMELVKTHEYQCDISRINKVNSIEDLIDYLLVSGIIEDPKNMSSAVENIILDSAKKYINQRIEKPQGV